MAKIIGVAGGSGSGKTYIARLLCSFLKDAAILPLDCYYRDQSHLEKKERDLLNYDDPKVLDLELFYASLEELKKGHTIEVPQYDFVSHTRLPETRPLFPASYIIAEGILIYSHEQALDHFDYKLYVDADPDIRLARRLLRDERERGREPFSIIRQYLDSVRPMHLKYVEPTKGLADRVYLNNGFEGLGEEDLRDILLEITNA